MSSFSNIHIRTIWKSCCFYVDVCWLVDAFTVRNICCYVVYIAFRTINYNYRIMRTTPQFNERCTWIRFDSIVAAHQFGKREEFSKIIQKNINDFIVCSKLRKFGSESPKSMQWPFHVPRESSHHCWLLLSMNIIPIVNEMSKYTNETNFHCSVQSVYCHRCQKAK